MAMYTLSLPLREASEATERHISSMYHLFSHALLQTVWQPLSSSLLCCRLAAYELSPVVTAGESECHGHGLAGCRPQAVSKLRLTARLCSPTLVSPWI
jgi:hypothetical protein